MKIKGDGKEKPCINCSKPTVRTVETLIGFYPQCRECTTMFIKLRRDLAEGIVVTSDEVSEGKRRIRRVRVQVPEDGGPKAE